MYLTKKCKNAQKTFSKIENITISKIRGTQNRCIKIHKNSKMQTRGKKSMSRNKKWKQLQKGCSKLKKWSFRENAGRKIDVFN